VDAVDVFGALGVEGHVVEAGGVAVVGLVAALGAGGADLDAEVAA
jgi:hypothetical protein